MSPERQQQGCCGLVDGSEATKSLYCCGDRDSEHVCSLSDQWACAIPQTDSAGEPSFEGVAAKIRLMGAGEIQERLGVGRTRAYQLVTRKDFPDPVAELQMGKVWLAEDVEEWIRINRPHLTGEDS